MKLIVKYYNEWGKFISISISVSSKGKVGELKLQISKYTNIPPEEQELNIVNGNEQFQLLESDSYLSQYPITQNCVIYVVNKNDVFSFEMPHQDSQQIEEQKSGITFDPMNPPSLSIISMQSIKDSFEGADIFNRDSYTFSEYINLISSLFDSVQKQDLDSCRMLLRLHKDKLLPIYQKAPFENKEEIAQKFDIINDIEPFNWSLFHLVTFLGNETLFIWALGEGGNINQVSKDGWDCVLLTIWQGQYRILSQLMSQPSVDVNRVSQKGPPLHLACHMDDIRSVEILLRHPKINIGLLNQKNELPLEIAGKQTRELIKVEMRKKQNPQGWNLLSSYQSSITSFLQLSQNAANSFMVNLPQRPPVIKGKIWKVSFFKLTHYQRYLVLDPESGVLARYKSIDDYPLNPNDLIALEIVDDVRLSRDLWFQNEDYFYIEITYCNKKIYFGVKNKGAARQWYEALRNSVGYVKYIHNKISNYLVQDQKKAQKSILKIMMQEANKEIEIEDSLGNIDQKSHIKEKIQQNKEKYKNNLNSVSEQSCDDEGYFLQNNVNTSPNESKLQVKQLRICDFELIEHIGKGSFGHVYKAKCKLNGQIYALKQQEKDKMLSNNFIKYVQSELNILKQLHHPFLVKLHFAFQTPYFLYLVLDYCGRGDLSRYMTRGVILDELTAKFLIAEIILAVEYLHEKNIIYRDLKPENIIIDDEGYIKLIDFGLSKEGLIEDFIAKSFCGSPAYLSPELVAGSGTTKATDIYSIGTILFEMLTGYPPFFCTNLKELLNNIRYQRLNIPGNISKGAENLLHKMLEKNPESRIGAKNIGVLKKHIFFAEINWDKLLKKQYIPPKLKLRAYFAPRSNLTQTQQIFNMDRDYENDAQRINELPGWNYGL